MMRISTRGRYALRAMIDLAMHSGVGPVLRQEIAERQGISAEYVAQLFSVLQKAGLVRGVKGPGGGYVLARAPDTVTALDIIQAVEGPVAVVNCVLPEPEDEAVCNRADCCAAYLLWKRLSATISEVLGTVTLRQLCDEARRLESPPVPAAGCDVNGEQACTEPQSQTNQQTN